MLRPARALAYLRCYLQVKGLRKAGEPLNHLDFCYSQPILPAQVRSEISGLLNLLAESPPQMVMEIGTSTGGTLFLLCKYSHPSATLISLDLPGGRFGGGYPAAKLPIFWNFPTNGQRLHLLRGNSHDTKSLVKVKSVLNGRKLDFLLIDGDHTFEGVSQDFDMYSPLMKRGGLIVVHDIVKHPPDTGCQVDRFWNGIKNRYPHAELVENAEQGWAGLGLLYV